MDIARYGDSPSPSAAFAPEHASPVIGQARTSPPALAAGSETVVAQPPGLSPHQGPPLQDVDQTGEAEQAVRAADQEGATLRTLSSPHITEQGGEPPALQGPAVPPALAAQDQSDQMAPDETATALQATPGRPAAKRPAAVITDLRRTRSKIVNTAHRGAPKGKNAASRASTTKGASTSKAGAGTSRLSKSPSTQPPTATSKTADEIKDARRKEQMEIDEGWVNYAS